MRITKYLQVKTFLASKAARALFFFTAFLFIGFIAGCLLGDDIETLREKAGVPPDLPSKDIPWTLIKISAASEINVAEDGSVQLLLNNYNYREKQFHINTTGGLEGSAYWVSTNPNAALIDMDGFVTAVGIGTAYIYVVIGDTEEGESNRIKITVAEHKISIAQGTRNLYTSGSVAKLPDMYSSAYKAQLSIVSEPDWEWINNGFTWVSSDTSIATVSDSGLAAAAAVGSAVITVQSLFDSDKASSVFINVSEFDNESGGAMIVRNLSNAGYGASPETPKLFDVYDSSSLPAILTNNGGGDRYIGINPNTGVPFLSSTVNGAGIGRATISYLMNPISNEQSFTWTVRLNLRNSDFGYTSGQRNGVAVGVFVDPFDPTLPMYQLGGYPGQIPELTRNELPFIGGMRCGTAAVWQFTDNIDGSFRDAHEDGGINNILVGNINTPVEIAVSWNATERTYSMRMINLDTGISAVLNGITTGAQLKNYPVSDRLFNGVNFHPGIMVIGQAGEYISEAEIFYADIKMGMPDIWAERIIIEEQSQSPKVFGLNLYNNPMQLSAKVIPDNADHGPITWYSSNESIAIVSSTGLVTPVNPGTSYIIARADGFVSDVFEVNVYENIITADSIKIDTPVRTTINFNDAERLMLTASIFPEYATFAGRPRWSSSNNLIAYVDPVTGLVTPGKNAGTVTITATDYIDNSVFDTLQITVTPYVLPASIGMIVKNQREVPEFADPPTPNALTTANGIWRTGTSANSPAVTLARVGSTNKYEFTGSVALRNAGGNTNGRIDGATFVHTSIPIAGKFTWELKVRYNRINDTDNRGFSYGVMVEPPAQENMPSNTATIPSNLLRYYGPLQMHFGAYRAWYTTAGIGGAARAHLGTALFPELAAPNGQYELTYKLSYDINDNYVGFYRVTVIVEDENATPVGSGSKVGIYDGIVDVKADILHPDLKNVGKYRHPAIALAGSSNEGAIATITYMSITYDD